ncbi:MAG: M23 family metallopeptidase [Clostridia bacterium]
MNNNSNQNKNHDAKGGKVALFFKKNVYVILMIACIVAIATMITVAAVVNSKDNTDLPPVINKPEDPDKPVVNPDDPDKKPVDSEFLMIKPVANAEVLKGFTNTEFVKNVTQDRWQTHEGVDFKAIGGAAVLCVFDGVVRNVTADDLQEGQIVTIDHNDGYTTTYKLLKNVKVTKGQVLKQGAKIGEVSDTALAEIADGTHLHFELSKNRENINPMSKMLEGDK